ncbi:MAG: DMT family transporter [Candidatus Omnitrophica bacterium]|nr:DMT family transporter [Candidatus Omnitrophota bacterium]
MKKYFPVTVACFLWIWPPIVIKTLSSYFDNFTQNFYRFLAASIVLTIFNLVYHKEEFLKEIKNIKKYILPAIIIFSFQLIWVVGLSTLTPTIGILIGRSSILFIAVFSFIFFKDERNIIKSKFFISGALLAVIGVIGVIASKSRIYLKDFNIGAAAILSAAILWAVYIMVIKKRVKQTEPLVAAGIILSLSVPLFFIASLFWGSLSAVTDVSAGINIILFVSGIFCVGVANAFNFKSIKIIGAALSSTFILITPFFTAIASYFIFKEILNIQQILFGIILITGCGLLLRSGNNSSSIEISK